MEEKVLTLKVLNPHPRDKRIRFVQKIKHPDGTVERAHYFEVDGVKWMSPSFTGIVKIYYPYRPDNQGKDEDYLRIQKNMFQKLADFGSMNHLHYHRWLNGKSFKFQPEFPEFNTYESLPTWRNFQRFLDELAPYWKVFRTEVPIFSTPIHSAGVYDAVFRDMRYTDKIVLMVVDWKVQQRPSSYPPCTCKTRSKFPMDHSPICNSVGGHPLTRSDFNYKYHSGSLQVSLVATVLESHYDAEVSECRVAFLFQDHYLNWHVDRELYEPQLSDFINSKKK